MGIKLKHIQPITQQKIDIFSILQKSYKDEQYKIDRILLDKAIPENEKYGRSETVD